MLYDFAEPICRACCNYEGIDRIAEVIEKARQLRNSFERSGHHHSSHGHSTHYSEGANQILRSPHHDIVGLMPAVSIGTTRHSVSTVRQQSPAYTVIPSRDGKMQVVACKDPAMTKSLGFSIPGISQVGFARMQPVSVAVPSTGAPIPAAFVHKPIPITEAVPTHDTTTQRFAQIQDTLNVLSKAPPFRVRFSKDHSLVGRVIAFDAVCRGSDYELKVFIEYPIGSQTVFQSASGAGRQMYGEFRERLGIGGGFRGASSNGYKDLEFERVFGGEDDWRMLGELLTEEVRFFRGPVKKELLSTPYLDPKFPDLPPATLNATRGFLRNNLNRKRKSSNEEEASEASEARKAKRLENGTGGADDTDAHSPKSATSPRGRSGSPRSPLNGSPQTNGLASSPVSPHSPSKKLKGSPPPQPQETVMQCLLCHRTLEDTRFVQCPSATSHKFCFTCSRESIKKQSAASSDVYCPSGMKCLVAGSSTPWAFMEQEIATILEASA